MSKVERTGVRQYSFSLLNLTAVFILILLIFVITPSFPIARKLLAAPLIVHNAAARGDACYIMAGGGSLWERLDAGADLFQMGRVSLLIVMKDDSRGAYRFAAHSSWTRTQWAADYLAWRGIPPDRVRWIDQTFGQFGTLSEARSVAKNLPVHSKKLVVVSSAPHMRRVALAFTRSLPKQIQITTYAATEFENSYERHHPIWVEYGKLLLYYLIA